MRKGKKRLVKKIRKYANKYISLADLTSIRISGSRHRFTLNQWSRKDRARQRRQRRFEIVAVKRRRTLNEIDYRSPFGRLPLHALPSVSRSIPIIELENPLIRSIFHAERSRCEVLRSPRCAFVVSSRWIASCHRSRIVPGPNVQGVIHGVSILIWKSIENSWIVCSKCKKYRASSNFNTFIHFYP